ncbi:MAG: aminotransferase class V-fold PLP-dependent enzyme [Paracoccaceae bacterium]|nr:aminotransferase class V-fold PLP-dependent enzyme [Thalassobium sp. R2A62]MDG1339146.1 aminotransferase class V-fold PLP-dependent enzyme [Paracoccaceae bacterium]MDG2451408.1 aminotransferase class V-fold PLP-dependent enzyme [Paracoccaceae bacterium]
MMRVYLDHNATTPLRPEARKAMVAAMDIMGNPSSVHSEGRDAKSMMERARAQVAALVGCKTNQVIFNGSATEAAALAVGQRDQHGGVFASLPTEHDCLNAWSEAKLPAIINRKGALSPSGVTEMFNWVLAQADQEWQADRGPVALVAMSAANSETGILPETAQVVPSSHINAARAGSVPYSVICDITQMVGKMPVTYPDGQTPSYMILSAHKIGGPKGIGALINFTADDPVAQLRGGGQEMGRRSGTENIIGIAGFGAAAEAAQRDVEAGAWDAVAVRRNSLETAIETRAPDTIFVGQAATRLPNTTCMMTPGWKGETQVMQMDLAGFAISAGSACSSGKVKASTVLRAMGYDETEAACAIRVSLGLETTDDDIKRFADAWCNAYERHKARAA